MRTKVQPQTWGIAATGCHLNGVIVSLFLLTSQFMGQAPTPARVADASCAKCHAAIYTRYLTTPMANASGAASEQAHPAGTVHSGSGVDYTVATDASLGKARLHRSSAGEKNGIEPLDYFLGSGHLGTTYIYAKDKFLFESPVAWYAATNGFDMKPGLAKLQKTLPALPMQSGCLRCHMSDVQPSDPGTINHYRDSAFLHTGVTCEACHGDSTAPAANGSHVAVLKLANLSALKRDSICINCHLEGDAFVEKAGRSALKFAPGDSITDFVSYYVYGNKGLTARAVSEVEQFAQSGCKRATGEKMSCTSCHDPHFSPSKAERAEFYRGKCLACHREPEFAASHYPENKDCVSCHMKPTGAENVPHVAWTDHRILRVPEVVLTDLEHPKQGDLIAIFPELSSKRDLAMAYYKAMLAGDSGLKPVAWARLNGVRGELENDPEALDALGVLMAERGDSKSAADVFRKVLAIHASDLTALSNLGTLMAKEGRLDESLRLLNAAFARNQDLPGLALNVARVDCMAGDGEAARKALDAALVYNPGLESLITLESRVSHCPIPDIR